MANKRMFSKQIVHSDAFMDMSQGTQLLYFYLAMDGDDDGFVSNPKKIMRMIGANDDDYKILIAKRFIIIFENGICVIKHWFIHNYIQSDRYHETKYLDQKKTLVLKENNSYTEKSNATITTGVAQSTVAMLGQMHKFGRKGKQPPTELPEWLDKETWDEWVGHRQDKKKPLTERSIKLQLKFLEENKENHKAIILESIKNGWTGLFEYKGRDVTKKKGIVV